MKIDLIFPVLPPSLDGIGDHTAHLARALAAEGCTVRVLTAQEEWTPLRGVKVQRAFHLQQRRGILELIDVYRSRPHPDWLLLQFEQFSYGRWGLNPFLSLALRQIKRIAPATKLAVMFHENYTPARGVKSTIMSSWQLMQFWAIGQLVDAALFSIEHWAEKYRDWFPATKTFHLPVGSNIPKVDANSAHERKRLGIDPDAFVIGVFGSAHPSRLLSYIDAAASACTYNLENCQVLYVGPDGNSVRKALENGITLLDMGALPASEVSRCFSTVDLYLAPFEEGVSTRRGSFLFGLQHGIATASTYGSETGPLLLNHAGSAFVLSPYSNSTRFAEAALMLASHPEKRSSLTKNAQLLFSKIFSWARIARRLTQVLESYPTYKSVNL